MKLDAKLIRYLSNDDYRVLTAVEMGSRNHEIVPTALIGHIAALKHGGTEKVLSHLAKHNFVSREKNARYDGYRLTYGGYDYLALKTMTRRGSIYSVGNQIGVGKESDIIIVANEEQEQRVLKIHRLGRVSFRTIKSKRDYLRNLPTPYDQNRHCIVMGLIDAFPLSQINEVAEPGKLYSKLMDLIVRLACAGLIHGDFNEFNLLVTDDGEPVLIDFPQMVSTSHRNAEMYFNRDVECIRVFFRRRFNYESSIYPRFSRDTEREFNLDIQVSASGFTKQHQEELEQFMDEEARIKEEYDDEEDAANEYHEELVSDSDQDEEEEEEEEQELDAKEFKKAFEKSQGYSVDDIFEDPDTKGLDNGDGFPTIDDAMMKMSNSVESLTMQEQPNQNENSDSEENSDDDDEIYINSNKDRKPFRDALSRVRGSSPTPSKASTTTSKTKLDADEIRQRVKKGMMGKGTKSAAKTGGRSRNQVKSSSKREANHAAKDGKSGFWS
ncbi:serine/threonine-protein kinase RIO2-like protein [Obelidium mucronatum]|nr:serine/threonine-protein kinase RIO2-like protein [Obelidium mucronatum]